MASLYMWKVYSDVTLKQRYENKSETKQELGAPAFLGHYTLILVMPHHIWMYFLALYCWIVTWKCSYSQAMSSRWATQYIPLLYKVPQKPEIESYPHSRIGQICYCGNFKVHRTSFTWPSPWGCPKSPPSGLPSGPHSKINKIPKMNGLRCLVYMV